MGSYDVAETCEQLGSFLLSQLQNQTLPRQRIGHFKHHTEREENIKKEICCIFNHNGLQITIEANEKTIGFFQPEQKHLPAIHKA